MQVVVDRRASCSTRRVDVVDDLGSSGIIHQLVASSGCLHFGRSCLSIGVGCLDIVGSHSCLSHRCSDVADTFLSVSHGHLNVGRGCPDVSLGCLEVRHSCLNVSRGCLNTGRSCFSVCHGFLTVGRFLNVGGIFVDDSLGCPDISRRWRHRMGWWGGGGISRIGLEF